MPGFANLRGFVTTGSSGGSENPPPRYRDRLDLSVRVYWLGAWGDVMGAKRLVRVDNVHALLPVPNLMARGASKSTADRFVDELREACSLPTHPGLYLHHSYLFCDFR
jgi:hypothetical protein